MSDIAKIIALGGGTGGGGGGKPYHAGTNPPSNTNIFWVDTSDDVTISLVNGVLTFVGVDTITDIELVGTELRMR